MGTIKSRTELVQQLAEAAPALVVAAEAVEGLWLRRELLRQDPAFESKMAKAIGRSLAARGIRTPTRVGAAVPSNVEAARIEDFRRLRAPFAEAFASLSLELAGLLRAEGVEVDNERAPSACAVLDRRASSIAMVLDAGQVPERADAGSFRDWGALATLVECEVATLARATHRPGGGEGAGVQLLTPQRQAELAGQIEKLAAPLLQFTHEAYRRGWDEQNLAGDDLDKARSLRRPFAEALDQVGAALQGKLRTPWIDLDGWGGASALGILNDLATMAERSMERGQLPRDRRYLVGEGMSKMLVSGWWERLQRHVQHEVDLLAGRASGPLIDSPVHPATKASSEPTSSQERAQLRRERMLAELPGPSDKFRGTVKAVQQRLADRAARSKNDALLEALSQLSPSQLRRDLETLRSEGLTDQLHRRKTAPRAAEG